MSVISRIRYVILLSFIIIPSFIWSYNYKYISPEDGLSNRRIYQIQKDQKGYMWFLASDGLNRYDGKIIKKYKLNDGFEEIKAFHSQNWLLTDTSGKLYQVGYKGRVFKYDSTYDLFRLIYRIPSRPEGKKEDIITYASMNSDNNLWICGKNQIYIWNPNTKETKTIDHPFKSSIKSIAQVDSTHLYIGTERNLHYVEYKNGSIHTLDSTNLGNKDENTTVNSLYYCSKRNKLVIGTASKGVCIINPSLEFHETPNFYLDGVAINKFKEYNNNELVIATDSRGVYSIDLDTELVSPLIIANYENENEMNGNTIKDIYIDEDNRIWMANFPIGVTVRDNRFSSYKWIKHSIGNPQSIINNKINAIIKDQDGDIWFATSNGVSLYKVRDKKWHSFFYASNNYNKCTQFLSLSEVVPGKIWATGYDANVYSINKKDLTTDFISLTKLDKYNIKPDIYIRAILKDSDGDIWLGGYHNFKKIDIKDKSISFYDINKTICIIEKDPENLWVGTNDGLFLLNKKTKSIERITLPVESEYIYSLYQDNNNNLYIGTASSGLLIYNPKNKQFNHFYTENSSLISNSICTILSDENNKYVVLGTESGLSRYYPNEKKFRNWTKDQGLMSIYCNSSSGLYYGMDYYVFGTTNGAIFFLLSDERPQYYKNKMVLSDFRILYETVYPGEKYSPLKENIDDTKSLVLDYNQNIFSLEVSSINYAYPSDVLYTWKLEGFYDKWRKLSRDNVIRYTNLSPGKYVLHIRAVSNENQQIVLEERSIQIKVNKPIWRSIWAYLLYATILTMLSIVIIRYFYLRRQKNISNEKIQFFINSAHDIRTPLTLIKAPLEEIREKELLSQNGMSNMNIALRNVNSLLRLTTNLINFEKTDVYSSDLYISEHELNSYITEIYQTFRSYANVKHINFNYTSNFQFLNVWFDKDKMDSILKNVISNALKYTPENGEVTIIATETSDNWIVEVKDTGIGVPASEQKKLFKMHFRGSNAINSKVTGSGIGLLLVWKLVRLHGGKIQFNSIEQKGSDIKIVIPKNSQALKKAHLASKTKNSGFIEENEIYEDTNTSSYQNIKQTTVQDNQRILIVEDNDELRNYLKQTLAETYIVQTCENGKEALTIVKEYKPNLIISDIMMPEMRGDEMCKIIKSNIETSHIPVILLTALSDEKSVLQGITIGADEYIGKPFNIGILKATITNILTNRAIIQKKYANLEIHDEADKNVNYHTDIDWKFISTVKKHVEDNMDNQAFNVDILCNLLNMSRTSFYNKIKVLTNQAPADYVRIIRLSKAAALLKEGKHSIIEVAEMTGFNDAKYFREVFKKHFKVSPSKYAKGETAEESQRNKESKEEK